MGQPQRLILADTSAWIEYLRQTETTVDVHLDGLVRRSEVATTEPVAMEVLDGARDDDEHRRLRQMLGRAELLPITGFEDYESAARIRRRCRAAGDAPRSIVDCLIAAVAIRHQVPVLHRDRDFELIARHTALQIAA